MAAPSPSRVLAACGLLGALLVGWLGVAGCGPSDLARAYDPFRAAVEPRLEDETRLWDRVAEAAAAQGDERGDAAYRALLETKARPYYAALEKDFAALEPGHERLTPARDALVAYVRARREFVDIEIERLGLAKQVHVLAQVQQAQDDLNAAQSAYQELIADDVPDNRYSEFNSCVKDFVKGPFDRAVTGSMDPAEAVERLRRDFLPRSRRLRDSRFDDDPKSRAFRKAVVAADDFLQLLADHLPTLVGVLRAKERAEAAGDEATVQQKAFQRIFADAQRDR